MLHMREQTLYESSACLSEKTTFDEVLLIKNLAKESSSTQSRSAPVGRLEPHIFPLCLPLREGALSSDDLDHFSALPL